MDSYRSQDLKVDDLDAIKLPKFQRGFVWPKKKKEDFVQTLHNGYPFGTLLIYPLNSKGTEFQLLDGQQRLSTIKQYKENSLEFWKPLNRDQYEAAFNSVNELLGKEKAISESCFDKVINYGDRHRSLWALRVLEKDHDATSKMKSLIEIMGKLEDSISEFVDLEHLQIPAIVYLGDQEHIADVFANLNKGGTPLSKYEVFNAAWSEATIHLATSEDSPLQEEILQNVKKYYLDMSNDAEFEIENFSEDAFTHERTITLAEFGTALGQYVVNHLPALIPKSKTAASEIGFGLLGVVQGIDNRKLEDLYLHKQEIEDNVESILQKTELICNNLQSCFSKLLRRFRSEGDSYENGLSTTFKTLSYFAALWKFEQESAEYKTTLRNITAAYVYDALTSVWSSHGDQRLMQYQNQRNYLEPIPRKDFKEAFDRWIDDQNPGINFKGDVKCLVSIHANLSYLSASIPDGEAYELEHIVAKKKINDVDANPRQILGNSLGNCMYLPHSLNNAKSTRTLYEVKNKERYQQLIEDSSYFSESDLNEIDDLLDKKDYTAVNGYIKERAKRVADAIVDSLLASSIR